MMIHGSMIWNFVNSMPQVYRGSPLVIVAIVDSARVAFFLYSLGSEKL